MMNQIVIDTSAIVAVLVNEPTRPAIVQVTQGTELIAPASVHWEIANAFSAMFKQNRLTLDEAITALHSYFQIPIRFVDVELKDSLTLAYQFNLYAYDAYLIRCAQKYKALLLSLDKSLLTVAQQTGVSIIEVV